MLCLKYSLTLSKNTFIISIYQKEEQYDNIRADKGFMRKM